MSVENTAKELAAAFRGKQTPTAYDTSATVTRVDGDTLWVHIPGGVDETPVKRTVGASIGDEIQIRVGGGRAWAVGNASAPPTDDTRANIAIDLAGEAVDSANIAYNAAVSAQASAMSAQESAETASAAAEQAVEDAATADAKAVQATAAAATADTKATEAQNSATSAATAASNAQTSADNAGQAAHSALTQLSTVEDVVGTLNWISEHGSYVATTDTEVVAGKLYFTRTGSGTEQDPYVYTVVTNPTGNPSTSGYFELDSIDEAVSNYVASHLALTDEGLYVINDQNGWRVLIKNDGIYIIDSNGTIIARYKDTVTIGDLLQNYARVSNYSFQLVDRDDNIYFDISDFRNSDGEYSVADTFTGNGSTKRFSVRLQINRVTSVKIDNVAISDTDYSISSPSTIVFNTAPADQSSIVISYVTTSDLVKSYTFGLRGEYRYGLSNDTEVVPGKHYYHMVLTEDDLEYWEVTNPTGSPYDNSYFERFGLDYGDVGFLSVAEGLHTTASGTASHVEGNGSRASGAASHAEGSAVASGEKSHAEGDSTRTTGYIRKTLASGASSHAEGDSTIASGVSSHAEGILTNASGDYSHAEGRGYAYYTSDYNVKETIASGTGSHAEGQGTVASGEASHAEGSSFSFGGYLNQITTAGGNYSHAEGLGTLASGEAQHVFGKLNIEDQNDTYIEIVGNGTAYTEGGPSEWRIDASNARTLDWDGNEWLAGNLTINGSTDVGAELTTLNNKFSGPTWLTDLSTSSIAYTKFAGIVTISNYANIGTTIPSNTWTTLGTLPDGYRPSRRLDVACTVGYNADLSGVIRIGTNGNIDLWSYNALTPSTAFLSFTVSYPV